jgi:hypothetical protein
MWFAFQGAQILVLRDDAEHTPAPAQPTCAIWA